MPSEARKGSVVSVISPIHLLTTLNVANSSHNITHLSPKRYSKHNSLPFWIKNTKWRTTNHMFYYKLHPVGIARETNHDLQFATEGILRECHLKSETNLVSVIGTGPCLRSAFTDSPIRSSNRTGPITSKRAMVLLDRDLH